MTMREWIIVAVSVPFIVSILVVLIAWHAASVRERRAR